MILVHAEAHIGPRGFPVLHAWCELPEGLAYDGTRPGFYGLAQFRAFTAPRGEMRFTAIQAARHVCATGVWGAWWHELWLREQCDWDVRKLTT